MTLMGDAHPFRDEDALSLDIVERTPQHKRNITLRAERSSGGDRRRLNRNRKFHQSGLCSHLGKQ